MSAGDETKTKQELLAEIEALKAELERLDAEVGPRASASSVDSVPMTRRESMASWVAPVILSLPVFAAGMVLMPGTALALPSHAPSFASVAPTASKKSQPTAAPTAAPTGPPTVAPTAAPTAAPTVAPTMVGRCIVPAPTVSPTLGMAAAPDAGAGALRWMALGNARRAAGVELGW